MNNYCKIESPLGLITLQANDEGLLGAWFETQTTQAQELGNKNPSHLVLKKAKQSFKDYFAGDQTSFDLPLAAKGTVFQKRVWQALTQIPFGETWTYQDIANHIQNPKAVRAVGLANGKNPISVIVPCHRVIGKNGKLTGYAGGVERKEWLLRHESQYCSD